MSNKENRAKRAKIKAKNNRLQKANNKKEEANERREYLSGLHTPQLINKQPSNSTVNDETVSSSFFNQGLNKVKKARFSSMNTQYNALYGTVDEFQVDALGESEIIYTIDEEGIYKTFNRLNELVCAGKLATSDFITVKKLYRDYLAAWCLSVTEEEPKEVIPYFDWWVNGDQYISSDEFGKLLSIKIQTSSFDELSAIFEIATHIPENNKLISLLDEFIGYTYAHENNPLWNDNAIKVIEYIDAYELSEKAVLNKH